MKLNLFIALVFISSASLLGSCQKESGGDTPVVPKKPRVGTIWTYQYYTYNVDGTTNISKILNYKAKAQETLGGNTYLKIVDMENDTLVYYLRQGTGGLFQYANGADQLFCKSPAAVNDTYNSYHEGAIKNWKVISTNTILPTGVGDVPVNYYEGYMSTILIDMIWYNEEAWLVRKTQYRNRSLVTPTYLKYSAHFIDAIVY